MKRNLAVFLLILLSGCDEKKVVTPPMTTEQKKELDLFLSRVKADMVYMPAGTFLMGDFCSEMRNGGAYCTIDKNNKPAHKVELSAFSISKNKITHEEYSFYLKTSGLPPKNFEKPWRNKSLSAMTAMKEGPAIINWYEADNYCSWLREKTGLNYSLPTEAQWEYSARNKGQYISIATDDGSLRYDRKTNAGENFATEEDIDKIASQLGIDFLYVRFAVDKYPPSPAGINGMAENGKEWVIDWYDPDWYKKSPVKDPQGPESGVIKGKDTGQHLKVLRGAIRPSPGRPSGLTFSRSYKIPEPDYPAGITARCVVNEPEPLN
jgi:formylglycine-generating enzyme